MWTKKAFKRHMAYGIRRGVPKQTAYRITKAKALKSGFRKKKSYRPFRYFAGGKAYNLEKY